MDALVSCFDDQLTLGGDVKRLDGDHQVYISEISSPTRLYIQLLSESQEHVDLIEEMR